MVKWVRTKQGDQWKTRRGLCSKWFQWTGEKLDRYGEGGWKTLGLGNRNINTWYESELELAWSKKRSSNFVKNFPIFLLSSISNTSIFNVHHVSHWVHSLVMKTFSNVFCNTFCWDRNYLNIFYIWYLLLSPTSFIYIKGLFFPMTIKWCFCWYCWWWGFFSVFPWNWIHITLATDTEAEPLCFTQLQNHVETLSIKMAFNRIIGGNRMIRGHVNLVICLN